MYHGQNGEISKVFHVFWQYRPGAPGRVCSASNATVPGADTSRVPTRASLALLAAAGEDET